MKKFSILLLVFLLLFSYLFVPVFATDETITPNIYNNFYVSYGVDIFEFNNFSSLDDYDPTTDVCFIMKNQNNAPLNAFVVYDVVDKLQQNYRLIYKNKTIGIVRFINGSAGSKENVSFNIYDYGGSEWTKQNYWIPYPSFFSNDFNLYSPVNLYNYDDPSTVYFNKRGYMGQLPYFANTVDQLSSLSVGEIAINTYDISSLDLILTLYNDDTGETIFTQNFADIPDLNNYVCRLDVDDPFSDLVYAFPWNMFDEFEFVNGTTYRLLLLFNSRVGVEGIERTFTVDKTIKNIDIPSSFNPSPTPTVTPDPNQGLIDSNKETQNILNDQTNAIKEQTETNKNIFQKLGDILSFITPWSENFFVYKLLELLFEGLKSFILPSSDFLSNFFSELSDWFQARLGFLWTPFDIVNDFLERINNNSLFVEPIIHIPNIYEPFTGTQLISATDYNLNSLLDNSIFSTVYNFYLVIVDFIIYLGVITLCYNTIVSVFRGSPDSISVSIPSSTEEQGHYFSDRKNFIDRSSSSTNLTNAEKYNRLNRFKKSKP